MDRPQPAAPPARAAHPIAHPRLSRHLDTLVIQLDEHPGRPRRDVLRLQKRIAEAANRIPDSRRREVQL